MMEHVASNKHAETSKVPFSGSLEMLEGGSLRTLEHLSTLEGKLDCILHAMSTLQTASAGATQRSHVGDTAEQYPWAAAFVAGSEDPTGSPHSLHNGRRWSS